MIENCHKTVHLISIHFTSQCTLSNILFDNKLNFIFLNFFFKLYDNIVVGEQVKFKVTIGKFRSLLTNSHTTLKSVCFNNECEMEIIVWNVEWRIPSD